MRCIYLRSIWRLLPLLALIGLIGGCGGSDSKDPKGGSEAYRKTLRGLERAADAHPRYGGFDAVGRARDLKPVLRASLDALCEVNREMLVNREAWKADKGRYYVVRIRLRAERNLPFTSTSPVNAALREQVALLHLTSFDPGSVRRYEKACYPASYWY